MRLHLYLTFTYLFVYNTISAKIILVDINSTYKKVSEAAPLLNDGDTLYINNANYINDKQVTFTKNNLYIKGINGTPKLEAGDIIANDMANGKGIFVIKGNNVTVENITFSKSKVQDHNGAGIRQEGCNLKIINCIFLDNEMGILCGTIPNCKTTIEFCHFENNGSAYNPGFQHNVYINNIDTLIFQFNYCINAKAEGHELKSRAKFNYIAHNHIGNRDTEDSRTIDLPNGGISILTGNVIEQGMNSANNNIIGYGLEGMSNPGPHQLYLINNTVINKKDKGSFIHIPTEGMNLLSMYNNLFIGKNTTPIIGNASEMISKGNLYEIDIQTMGFALTDDFDYRIRSNSKARNIGVKIDEKVNGYSLFPLYNFYTIDDYTLRVDDDLIDAGAFEFDLDNSTINIKKLIRSFPNPVSDRLYTNTDYTGEVVITNHTGSQLKLEMKKGECEISKLKQGLYYLESKSFKIRFIKI